MVSSHSIHCDGDHQELRRGFVRSAVNFRASGPGVHDFPPLIIAAVRASYVRLFHFMTVGALGKRRSGQEVVRAPLVLPGM
jgi:hypothetical protein